MSAWESVVVDTQVLTELLKFIEKKGSYDEDMIKGRKQRLLIK